MGNKTRMTLPDECTSVTDKDVLVIAKAAKDADMSTTLAMFSSLLFACEMFKAIAVPLDGGNVKDTWFEYCKMAYEYARNNSIQVGQLENN